MGSPTPLRWYHSKIFKKMMMTTFIVGILSTILALAGYWVLVPKIAEDIMRKRLAKLEHDGEVQVNTGSITPDGLSGVLIKDFSLKRPEDAHAMLHIKKMRVHLNKSSFLAGKKVISRLMLDEVSVRVQQNEAGVIDWVTLAKRLRRHKKSSKDKASAPNTENTEKTKIPSFFKHFGGAWPDVEAKNIEIALSLKQDKGHQTTTHNIPVKRISIPSMHLISNGLRASMETQILVTSKKSHPHVNIPKTIVLNTDLALPLHESTGELTFDTPLKLQGFEPYPYLIAGVGGIDVKKGGIVRIQGATFGTIYDRASHGTPMVSVEQVEIEPDTWTRSWRTLRLKEFKVHHPVLNVRVNKNGASNLGDLLLALRPNAPQHVLARSKQVAHAIMTKKEMPSAQFKPQASVQGHTNRAIKKPSKLEHLWDRARNILPGLVGHLPHKASIVDATILIKDERVSPVVRPAKSLQLTKGRLSFVQDKKTGHMELKGSFGLLINESQERGTAKAQVVANWRTRSFQLTGKIHKMDLSWVAQVAGPRIANFMRGGLMSFKGTFSKKTGAHRMNFKGSFALNQGNFFLAPVAETPMTQIHLGYDFDGYLNPTAPIPKATLLTTALDANVPTDPDAKPSKRRLTIPPPTQGALVFTRGNLRVNKIKGTFKPAFYGLAIDKPLPARFDATVHIPSMPMQDALDSVPSALLGDLAGTKMNGLVSWNTKIEVPVYDASEMIWKGEPVVQNFELISIANSMDVRKLTQSYVHTIEDKKVLFERRIRIQEMRPIPGEWLKEQAQLSDAQLDGHWRKGGWFPPPMDMDGELANSPNYWMSPHIQSLAAPKPWIQHGVEVEAIRMWKHPSSHKANPKNMERAPYGAYHYVPLHHISPYLPRAILTTEDNSFFRSDGFNRHAWRESIERNLAAGAYARGASTISMQLIKNLFLTRKKVISRKVQEAFLVWLMESVIHVPKARILELYLNVIEFGPGIYGIHDASVHYFGKRPNQLTLAECAWLVTIVPGPKKHHAQWVRGAMTDSYFNRIKRYMRVMLWRERITQEEYDEASAVKPEFYKPEVGESAIRPVKIEEIIPSVLPVNSNLAPFENPFDLFE